MEPEGFTPVATAPPIPVGPAPWSGTAIAGFVCSLIGCLGITALAGFILGVVGLFATSGGKRRGFGFAVAAIPISLLSGIASGFLLLAVLVSRQIVAMPDKVENAFSLVASDPAKAADSFRSFSSDAFNDSVSDAELAQWFASVSAEHGTLTKILVDPRNLGLTKRSTDAFVQTVRGKFVNGTVDMELTFGGGSGFGQIRLDDISIGGSSPRDKAPAKPET